LGIDECFLSTDYHGSTLPYKYGFKPPLVSFLTLSHTLSSASIGLSTMLSNILFTAALAVGLTNAMPQATGTVKPSSTRPATTTTAAAASGNPFAGKDWYANPYYSSEIHTLAMPSLPASLKPAASAVAKVGSFVWMDTRAKIPLLETYLADMKTKNAAGSKLMATFVVYDLPERDCAALASNGELKLDDGGEAKYKTEYIDKIAAIIKKYPDVKVNLAIEPDCKSSLLCIMPIPPTDLVQPLPT
jgi:cellulose 1,4-beta-cellobiosidase